MPAGTDLDPVARGSSWASRAALYAVRLSLREALDRIDRELTPLAFHGSTTEELIHGSLTIAVATFDGSGDPDVRIGGVQRSRPELEALSAWIFGVLSRADREQVERGK
jgi:hypothetical protein